MPDQGGADRLPPHSREAECSVLGSALRDNLAIDDIIPIVTPDHFYLDAHQKIFRAILTLHNDHRQPVDLVTLAENLKQQKQIEDIGGYAYLAELWDAAPTAANAVYYAKIVRQKALTRNLIHAGNEILRDAYDGSMPAEELLEQAERKVFAIAESGVQDNTSTLHAALQQAYDRIDARTGRENRTVSGLSTGFLEMNEITAGLQNGELVVVAARPSVGKCLAHDAEIVLADGSVVTIEEVFRRRQAKLLTLGDDWRLRLTEPSAYVDDGIKPVYRVTTRLGRQVTCTLSHPFRTLQGWQPLAELGVGDRVAVPRRIDVFGNEPMRDCEAKLLGYFIGDGGLTGTNPNFTNSNPRLQDDFRAAVAEFGGVTVRLRDWHGTRTPTAYVLGDREFIARHRSQFAAELRALATRRGATNLAVAARLGVEPSLVSMWRTGKCVPNAESFAGLCALLEVEPARLARHGLAAISKNSKNPLTLWLQRLGLWGQDARGKHVPAAVFRLPRRQLALFLNRLFATDGWATVLAAGNTQLGYGTVSERLARQVQHLLLRFGILASLRRKLGRYDGKPHVSWQLDITDGPSIRCFADEIGIFGKEPALDAVRRRLELKRYQTNRDLIPVAVWDRLAAAKGEMSWCELGRRVGLTDHTNLHAHRRAPSRPRLAKFARVLGDEALQQLAASDVYWDEIVAIEAQGSTQVYDLTIPETHNFVANDVCVHNTAFALSLGRNIAIDEKQPIFFVSLEQSRVELAERMMAMQSRVNSSKIRSGHLSSDDMQRLIVAGDQLGQGKFFIDDTPGQSMLRIAANARRLKRRENIRAVMIDYLQLIEPEDRRDPRHEQVAQISRRLKLLARELDVPVIALAQLNRGSEDRQDHRPRTSDLRESGCLTGDTLITLADTGERVPIRSLVGKTAFRVWSLNESTLKLEAAEVSRAFCTGSKSVFKLTTKLGRVIRATANHPFRTICGWRRLDELAVDECLALPRHIPASPNDPVVTQSQAALLGHLIGDGCTLPRHAIQYTTRELDLATLVAQLGSEVFGEQIKPRIRAERRWYQVYLAASQRLTHRRRNAVAEWLDSLGVFGFRSHEKRVPEAIFRSSANVVAVFLRHLWATDGCIRPSAGKCRHPAIYYASSSERLARDVQSLLLRLGINAVVRSRDQGTKGRQQWHVLVMGHDDILRFADHVGAVGQYKSASLAECRAWLTGRRANTNRDVIPSAVWRGIAVPAMMRNGVTLRGMQRSLGMACMGTTLYKQNISRERMGRLVGAVGGDARLAALAGSDVYWDRILSIEPDGEEEVFDLTVPGPANFVANEIFVHNSIEQDADVCMLLHRPELYDPASEKPGVVEVIIGKQRNGPTGTIILTYLKEFMLFTDFEVDRGYSM